MSERPIGFGKNPAGGSMGFRPEFGELGAHPQPGVVAGPGMYSTHLGNGRVALGARKRRSGGAGAAPGGLQVRAASPNTVIITPGYVYGSNGKRSTPKIGGQFIDWEPPPELTVPSNGYIGLKIEFAYYAAMGPVDVVFSNTYFPYNTALLAYVTLAWVTVINNGQGLSVSQYTLSSLVHQACGSEHYFGPV
jgi:hypothetical protein